MGAIRDNIGKYYRYAKGKLFSETGGQNLNVDLQKNLADELDSILDSLAGTAVVGGSSWVVSPTVNPLEVRVSAGEGFFAGQRGKTTADFVVTPQLAANTNGVQIYIELDDSNTGWDSDLSAYPVRVGSAGPLSTLPSRSIMLATVNTPASGVIAPSSITDQRRVVARDFEAVNGVTDGVALSDTALSLRQRFDMILTRLRTIMGTANWKDNLPGAGVGSLSGIWAKFNKDTGHDHSGSPHQGPKLVAENINSDPTTNAADTPFAIGVTATNVQAAIEQLVERKLSRSGIQAMLGPLILARDPLADLEAATKRYVDQRINMAKVTSTGIRSFLQMTSSEQTLTVNQVSGASPSPIALSARGGIIRFEGNAIAQARITVEAQAALATWSVVWTARIRFRLYRDGVLIQEAAHPLDFYVGRGTGANFLNTWVLDVPIPTFYDPSPGGTPTANQARTYDLRCIMTNEVLTVTPGVGVVKQVPTFGGVNLGTPALCGQWFALES